MSKAVVLLGDLGSDHEGFPPTPVLAGSPDVLIDGKPVARVGDPLAPHSKPKHPPHPRAVAAGSGTVMINGMPAAVTGGAVTCGGVTIGSGSVVIGDTHTPAAFSGVTPMTSTARSAFASSQGQLSEKNTPAAKTTEVPRPLGAQEKQSAVVTNLSTAEQASGESVVKRDQAVSEPGFHVVRQPMSKNELLTLLYDDASAKPDNFERLNPGLSNRLLPGEMIVVADPNSHECTIEENHLMEVAQQVNQEVRQLSESEAQFIVDHYDLLEMMTSNAATGLGVGASMIGQQIKSINTTLKELEVLHQDTFRKHGKLSHPEFFEQRQRLFTKLDFALGKVARKGMSLDDNAKLKRALGLSSKSIVHEWKTSGVDGIPEYGTNYTKASNAARFIENGGRLALALDISLTGYKIYEACSVGRAEQCEQVSHTESGRLVGSVVGGSASAYVAPLLCTVVGVGTGGIGGVACGIVAAGVGGAVGGQIAGDAGADMGQLIYEVQGRD
ncbi:type VI secretion system PAAR protein [Marinobacter adhaerens]|uniref:Type VI secretion system PAAR protein n=1 Tax=Marinobacter adhaerens TaxID=1033846 RepID=A0A851HVQ7_9GAMM|nr:type VI secretion system PAAR protein [Marinobacter adhaerens]NWN91065.1 type VI secretion system PAAR protein [Marinobacter adhaerens]